MLCFSGCRFLGSGFRDNKWILLISFGCTNVDFVGGRWISWISLFRQTAESVHLHLLFVELYSLFRVFILDMQFQIIHTPFQQILEWMN